MSKNVNKFGLNRNIPSEIKQIIRQRCGFGCVVCGSAIYQYEHFNPEFINATFHDDKGITLLCGGCHDRKSRGLLSTETVYEFNSKPKCLENGFSNGPFDIGNIHPQIVMGSLTFINVPIPISVLGESIFKITPPSVEGKIFKISATLRNNKGNIILQIEENEWLSSTTNWDCKVEGQRIILRSGPGKIDLILRSEPPQRIVIEQLKMTHKGIEINCSEGKKLTFKELNGSSIETSGGIVKNADIGIAYIKNLEEDNHMIAIGVGDDAYVQLNSIKFSA